MSDGARFARRVFGAAGIYGIVCLLPMYFIEGYLGQVFPPPVTHPEFFYGFAGVALAFQVLFLLVARDPIRHRDVMIPSIMEKLGYGLAVVVLVTIGRTAAGMLPTALIDLGLAVLFAMAWMRTGAAR
jgi:hypothetical protein